MSVPIYNGLYTVLRPTDLEQDGQDEFSYETVATDVRGCTVYHSGSESVAQGSRERVDARIMCDPLVGDGEIAYYDRILDQTTSQLWYVAFARKRVGFGLDHWVLGVYEVQGAARGTRDA